MDFYLQIIKVFVLLFTKFIKFVDDTTFSININICICQNLLFFHNLLLNRLKYCFKTKIFKHDNILLIY